VRTADSYPTDHSTTPARRPT